MPVVNSYTEWDPLEEVIVGRADHACIPEWHAVLEATMPQRHWEFFRRHGGRRFAAELLVEAARELDVLSQVLESEGVAVRRPDPVDWSVPFQTPAFGPIVGLYGAMPRDVLLVVGDEIIEAPMAWRCRYFEPLAYRSLLKGYFRQGARWTAAPKPELADDFYIAAPPGGGYNINLGISAVSEAEPVFDAADFCRVGRDIFCQRSHVTNQFGIAWLARHLGPAFRVHTLAFDDPNAMHIDASFVPLAPGRLLVNPARLTPNTLPAMFDQWEILIAPEPTVSESHPFYFTSRWLSLNVLSLDERRVVVEAEEQPMIDFLKSKGFEPIPVKFRNFGSLGGAFHCATCDVRRRGGLQSYF
ncbi:MAG: amidinotransferase [Azospirillum sp.]|nr:amidinotransferase [Azospirillum sp.]